MRILGIESASLVASVAIVTDDVITAEYTVNLKKTHSQTLLPMIDEIVKMLEVPLESIDAIAVSGGPGSFTGLRIGSATAKGLGLALKKDVSVEPPSYLVFFKGRDVDVMTAAFKEFSAKTVKQKEQPSIRHKLDQEKAQSKAQHKEKVKVKTKDRGVEL